MTTDEVLERIVDGRTALVLDYVARGQAATAKSRDGVRLLQWCAYFGDVSAMRFLLEHGESLGSLGASLGLHGAAFHGHWQLCEFLIENGADVNAGSERHVSPRKQTATVHSAGRVATPGRMKF